MIETGDKPPPGLGALRRPLYQLSFVDEFVPFAVLFTLWFTDNGITVAQLSLVFVVWAATALVLEVPSGVLADRIDRRRGGREALIHDQLEAVDAEREYGVVIARVGQFGNVGIAAAALVSTALLGLGQATWVVSDACLQAGVPTHIRATAQNATSSRSQRIDESIRRRRRPTPRPPSACRR